MMSMKNLVALLVVLAVSSQVQSFTAPSNPVVSRQSTELKMGLFDFLQPKKDKPSGPGGKAGKMDADVFGGKGAKITIREDEDNAMWIEEPSDKKKGAGKKKGGFFGR